MLQVFTSCGHDTIDTARRYPPGAPGTSESLIGEALELLNTSAPIHPPATATQILVDTKVLSNPGCHAPEKIAESVRTSLASLRLKALHTIYLHFPDRSVPLRDPVSALSHTVAAGLAVQWGLSNYTLAEVREVLALCDANGWVRPRVYQGEYSALRRGIEDGDGDGAGAGEAMLAYLHREGFAFYAFSPAAAGVFSPTSSRIGAATPVGDIVRSRFGSAEALAAVQRVRDAAAEECLGGHEVAIRWAFWDGALDGRFGDAVIIGAGSEAQLKETCDFIQKGGLDGGLRGVVDAVWETVRENKDGAQK